MIKEYRFTKDWPYHVSCGGVVYRREGATLQVLVLRQGDEYSLPKGTLHYGETLEQCALREVEEESGQRSEITGYLGGRLDEWVEEHANVQVSKITHYFAMRWLEDTGGSDDEYDGFEWMMIEQAQAILRPSGVEILSRFLRLVDQSTAIF